MARAAAGLARRCAQLLADRYRLGLRPVRAAAGRRRRQRRRRAATRVRCWPVAACAVHALLLDPERAHAGRPRRAAGRAVAASSTSHAGRGRPGRSTASSASVVGGRCAPTAAARWSTHFQRYARPTAPAPRSSPSTCRPASTSDTGDVPGDAGDRRRDGDLRLPEAGARGRRRRAARRPRRAGRHRAADRGCAARRRCGSRTPTTSRRGGRSPDPESDKYTRGVVGVATGSSVYTGAAVLSVGGACAGPAGLIRYAGGRRRSGPRRAPAVITTPTGSPTPAGCRPGSAAAASAPTTARSTELRAVLAAPVPVVPRRRRADPADRRHARPHTADLLRARTAPLVVTPHDREFARLAGRRRRARTGSRRRSGWPRRCNATVLLKGDRTIVASPDGTAWVNPTGTPALATGGTGDVLAGLIGSLLAAGLPPDRAAVAGAFVHGLAGRAASSAAGRSRRRTSPRPLPDGDPSRSTSSANASCRAPCANRRPALPAGRLGACGRRRSGST